MLRVAVLSRNLTFDRAWDVALASEASPRGKRRVASSRPLGEFLDSLPRLATMGLDENVATRVRELAEDVARTRFPAPDGFEDPIEFHTLGVSRRRRPWRPPARGYRTLALAPFVNRTGLDALTGLQGDERILVSRAEELDKLHADALDNWGDVRVLLDSTQSEPEDAVADQEQPQDGAAPRPSGLHAKMIAAIEHGWNVTWYVGSANLTAAAFTGRNVEMMASVTGRKGRRGGVSGHGIDRFLEGFETLCERYRREAQKPEDDAVIRARARIEEARASLVAAHAGGDLRVTCAPAGDHWSLTLNGTVTLPGDVNAAAWPISVAEDQARPLDLPSSWRLPTARLTAFIAFRLSLAVQGVDDVRLAMRLPASGIPEDRMRHVLSSLIDDPRKFLQFLRALLGGLDGMTVGARDAGQETDSSVWKDGLGGDTLLERYRPNCFAKSVSTRWSRISSSWTSFQRFKELLETREEHRTAAAELAQTLFQATAHDKKPVWTLLLSATPYTLHTADAEIEQEDHYKDFLATTRFLLGNDDARVEALKHRLSSFGAALKRAAAGERDQAEAVKRAKEAVEALLRTVMARTERVAVTEDHDAMVAEHQQTAALTPSDVRQYLATDALFHAVGDRDPMPFWKSAPYLAHFMHGYRFDERLDDATTHAPNTVRQVLERHRSAFL